jgi:predicted DsbA family dithiol-disulfide isomerase
MSRSGGRSVRSVRIEGWSDVVCPWCYIGKRRLEAALERFPHRDDVEVVRRSVQLDPAIPEGETHETLPALVAKFGRPVEDVRRMMRHVEFIVIDRSYGVSGAQPADLLLQVLERARADADAVAS